MYSISLKLLLVILVLLLQSQPSAREIVQRADDKVRGKSNQGEMVMRIVRPTWQREIGLKSWQKGKDLGMILITSPARDKGTAFLKRKREVWNWQPSIDRTIKLPPSMMLQSWMGSDFTNDDLVKESSMVEDYEHTLAGDTVIDGRPSYKIMMTPKEEAAVVWGKVINYIDKKDYLQLLVRFYDEDGELVNTMKASDIRMLGGRLLPARLEVTPADNPRNRTIIEYRQLAFDVPLEDGFFSIQNLKRIK
ncbi:outer membrane lipoprotein-sorting protein [Pontibacter anaerobius]|uniref:Outer membrane lipoprotein-sorting protein n=1 Tax=Pontibacter anaerobius TaxID=2993940 RepID=A0ABT3REH7_9BACT|nr:outer membrane lipoprotein-sorting protein [Pontibacter anaerobius]MCX2739813.1 outer membrane lipoprotein-sorting protein [Pontibacter anaerobius]